MSDGLPSDEQLRRIERGVQRRIRGRRLVAQRIAGTLVAVLLVAGGIALVRPVLTSTGSASSAGGSSGGGSVATVAVTCHGPGGATTVKAAEAGLPATALAACTAAVEPAAASARPHALQGRTPPTPSPSPTQVLCRTSSGALHVYLGGAATCTAHAMVRVRG
jgi:hypothetical protein